MKLDTFRTRCPHACRSLPRFSFSYLRRDIAAFVVLGLMLSVVSSPVLAKNLDPRVFAQQLTQSLVTMNTRYRQADTEDQPQLLDDLLALAVFALGVDDSGIQTRFASQDKEAAVAVDVAQIGQVEVAPVRQPQITSQALGLGPVVVFGIGVGTQVNGDRGILKQIHRAVQFDGGGTDGVKATGKDLDQGLVKGKRTAILKDQTVEFTEGRSGFKAQDFHRQLAHDVRERAQEELGRGGFEQLLIEGVIIGVEFPQLIELTVQIGDGSDVLGGHGGAHREAQTKRRDEAFALDQSEFFAALIENLFIEDRLELVGQGGKLLGLHPILLLLIKGLGGWMEFARNCQHFKRLDDQSQGVDSLSPYL
jgi:hypothetical protein